MDDIHDDVDEDGVNAVEEKICEISERYEHIDTRLEDILQEEVCALCMKLFNEVLLNLHENLIDGNTRFS